MPKPIPKKPTASKAGSVAVPPNFEIEVYRDNLWTVTNGGELFMPGSSPPAKQDLSYGQYWDVRQCGDAGGPPANKVREWDVLVIHANVVCVRCV